MDTAVAELRRFARRLLRLPHVEVKASLGAAASDEEVRCAKQNGLHPDILAFHSVMNGCSLRWRFRGSRGKLHEGSGGDFEIPTIGQLVADRSQHGVECEPGDRIQVVDRSALEHGSGRFPFYMNREDGMHAFDGDYIDYSPGSLALLVVEGISHLFSAGWMGNYGESIPADVLKRAQEVEADNRSRLEGDLKPPHQGGPT